MKNIAVVAILLLVYCPFSESFLPIHLRRNKEEENDRPYYRPSYRTYKRSARLNDDQNSTTRAGDPCNFNTYDINKDEVVTPEELFTVLENNEKIQTLLADLENTAGDGVIDEKEFYTMARELTMACTITDD